MTVLCLDIYVIKAEDCSAKQTCSSSSWPKAWESFSLLILFLLRLTLALKSACNPNSQLHFLMEYCSLFFIIYDLSMHTFFFNSCGLVIFNHKNYHLGNSNLSLTWNHNHHSHFQTTTIQSIPNGQNNIPSNNFFFFLFQECISLGYMTEYRRTASSVIHFQLFLAVQN